MTMRGVLWAAALWVVFLGCSASQAQRSQNLLQNSGFETGNVSPWTPGGGASAEVVTTLAGATIVERPPEGRSCLHVTVPKAGSNFWDVSLQYRGLVFAKGRKYTFSAFLKSKTGSVRVNVKPESSISPWTGYGQQVMTVSDAWREYHVTTPVFDSAVSPADVIFHIGFAPAEFWIDDVRLYEGEYVPTPFSEYVLPLPPAKDGVVELWGDQIIRGARTWPGNHYRIHGNLTIQPGGELKVEDATIEMMCTYDREFWIHCEGTLRTTRCTVGGAIPLHTMIQLEGGWWYATDTIVQYTYGTGFAWDKPSYLRANRLTAGVSSDSILIGGRADVLVQDSTYPINVTFDTSRGGTTTLDFPAHTPISRVYDSHNCPGALYRMELVNTRVPQWFLWLSNISSDGPRATFHLRDCPSLVVALAGDNLQGTFSLPACYDVERNQWQQYLPANTQVSFGSANVVTLNNRVNVTCWTVYLGGNQTDLTLAGKTNIAEFQARGGAVGRVVGDPGTHNAYLSCTTVDAFGASAFFVRNGTLGNPEVNLYGGQISAFDRSAITLESCVVGQIALAPSNGDITLVDCFRFGPDVKVRELPGSGHITWHKSMVRSTGPFRQSGEPSSNWVGMKIRTGAQALVVTKLGRRACPGNAGSHEMRIVRVRDRAGLCSASVSMASGEPDQNGFQYAPLTQSATLDGRTEYYVMCRENRGEQAWYGDANAIVTRPDVVALGFVSSTDLQTFREEKTPGSGLVNLLYTDPQQDNAHYRFDEGKGSFACDSLGCADGFLNGMGAEAWVPGRSGPALNFDGVDDYLKIPRRLPQDFTVSFWMKTPAPGPGLGSPSWRSGAGLLDGGRADLGDGFGISLLGDQIAFGVGVPETTISPGGPAKRGQPVVSIRVADGRWHHVAATRGADTGQMKLYVDGACVAAGTGPRGTKEVGRWIRVGSLHGDTNFFRGQMDDLRLYYSVLTPEEVADLGHEVEVPVVPTEQEPEPVREGFESANFSAFPWQHEGSSSWFITADLRHSGSYSARAGAIGDNGISTLRITRTCPAGEIRFYVRVASEEACDTLGFSVDGATVREWSGYTDWIEVKHPVPAGSHTFEWSYAKDDSSSGGQDTAWLDDVVFP